MGVLQANHQNRAGDKATDMDPDGHAQRGRCVGGGPEQILDKKGADHQQCGQPNWDEGKQQHQQAGPRIKHQIGPQNPRYRPARADHRGQGCGVDETVHQAPHQTANQEEQQEPRVPHRVLDIGSENPEKQHIENDVLPAPMQELIADQ